MFGSLNRFQLQVTGRSKAVVLCQFLYSPPNLHYDITPIQYTAIFHGCKNYNFQMKICDIFLIFFQNIDRRYTLEN